MEGFNTLLVDRHEGICRIVLNCPDRLNAFSANMYEDMAAVLGEVARDASVRVVTFTGAGRAFCAGANIPELLEASRSVESAQERERFAHSVMRALRNLRQPVIMAINGDAVGGGCSLALNGDLRIASDKARLGFTFSRVGLAPDMGCIFNLVHFVGISKAMELAYLGDIIDAKEAEKIGLINRVVPHDELEDVATKWATRLAAAPQLPLSLMKPAFYKAVHTDFSSELENEINIQTLCLASQDAKEGLTAFLEKRKPEFGRNRSPVD